MSAIAPITRGLAFALLLVAVLGKITPRTAFVDFADSLPLARKYRKRAAVAVIALEGISCAALITPVPAVVQYGPAAVLFVAFAVYIIVRYAQDHTFDCHCFGSRTRDLPTGAHVAMNLLVFAGCTASAFEPQAMGTAPAPVGDVIFYTGAGVIFGLVFVAAPTLLPVRVPR